MTKCKNCGEVIFLVSVLRHDTSNRPIEIIKEPNYCPFCACKYLPEDYIVLKKEENN